MNKLLIYIFALFLPLNLVAGNLFYVSSATDIALAMQTAVAGDTLIMANGFWTDQRIVFAGNGTAEKNIVLKAENSGQVVLNGTSNLRIAGSYLTVDGLFFYKGHSSSGAVVEFRNGSSNLANHCRLTGSAIENYNPSSNATDYKWISLYGTYNRVDHCFIKGKTHSGTSLVVWLNGEHNYHLIDNNYFGYRPDLGVNGGETIRIGTSDYSMTDSYTIVENNYFERCNGEIEIISNKSGHNVYRYNTFYECEGALTLRHGNYGHIYGNYFIGNNKRLTGGVRIIGEDHKVYNNYFENLRGTGFRSALTMVNGVPNSPLNRYFQVKRAEVVNNTFVNCDVTFNIGDGSDTERTLPPLDCVISNNIAQSSSRLIEYDDTPINMSYFNNIMFGGPLGIEQQLGIKIVDPLLIEGSDGILRIAENSPAADSASPNYNYVTDDLDGQNRDLFPDIGADEISNDLVIRKQLTSDDIGPSWYPPEIPPTKIIQVYAGHDSLKNALVLAEDDEIIELMTDGGIYSNSTDLEITKRITLKTKKGLASKPVIRNISPSNSSRSIFVIKDGGSLNINNIELDGMAGKDTPAKYLIRTDDNPMTESYKLIIDSCYFHDVSIDGDGNFFRAYAGTSADSIVIENTLFTNSGKEGLRLKDEASQSGNYNVENFIISNCTFWNISKEAIYVYGGDNVNFTPGPKIFIEHCTFDNCGYDSAMIIRPDECDDTYIVNSILSNGEIGKPSLALFGNNASVAYSDFFDVGEIELNRNASIGNGVIEVDPLYNNSISGDFTLPSNSKVLNKANNGSALGDLRWAVNPPSFVTLSIAIFGQGGVTTDPQNSTLDFDPGTVVTLIANPNQGYEFVQWSGDVMGESDIVQITMDSDKEVLAVFQLIVSVADQAGIPNEFNLYQNYPNPFNPSTMIKYALPKSSNIRMDLYNINGEYIECLVDDLKPAGYYQIEWSGEKLTSGTYYLRMLAGENVFIKKLLLIK